MQLNIKSLLQISLVFLVSLPTFAGNEGKQNRLYQKAARIHAKAFTIDSHNDTPMWFTDSTYNFGQNHKDMRPRNRVDIPRMEEGGLDAAFFAVFVGQADRTPEGNEKALNQAITTFEAIHRNVNLNSDKADIALKASDRYLNENQKKRSVFIGLENGYPIGNDLSNIDRFYKLGARYITLCHTRNNDICDSSTDSTEHNGVSEFGKNVIAEMNRLGMMVDVSHISDKSFYDVLELSKTPVIASHSCARALCDNPRNLTDDMLKALAAKDGVIQMCILSSYVKTPLPYPERDSAQKALRTKYRGFKDLSEEEMNNARREWYELDDKYQQALATVNDVVDHIDHIVQVAGIRHVGIGTDFDGGGAVSGCEDVSEMRNITLELVKRGYSAKQIKMIWGENLLRVMKTVEKQAKHNS
ncbi:MAG: membrane dipeptidase [Bacteroidetes bacterium HGW-Bacteroidetes-9]|jgi:membrane dipeptidase|nr:MAG: membrane dipeptidase [Bacteroidetes bacterium HGW-Bacteroidetes-9]